MSFTLLGIGTRSPDRRIAQQDAASLALSFANAEPGAERMLAALYRQTRIRSRGSVLLDDPAGEAYAQRFFAPATGSTDGGPSTGERMARYAREAGPLVTAAVAAALGRSGLAPADVAHLVTCSCTGFANPGVDLEIVRELRLPGDVSRTHVGFMGCHGAFNGLRVAGALAATSPGRPVVLACVELCSLHFQYGSRADHVVANSIFADGAAALVGIHDPGRPGWSVVAQRSEVLADTAAEMGWSIGDHGFEMTLSPRVPDSIGRELPAAVDRLLASAGLSRSDVGSWAVHPGGPRVLGGVQEVLGLATEAIDDSRAVLADHGNMSSATILFILARLVARDAAAPCVALAFGPGLTVEMALLTRVEDHASGGIAAAWNPPTRPR
ncbi:MAG: type III polyketide synthase [Planctomycetes bacterium]|nr:type III polyketide synthase [Planctomycetota bacterium]